MTSVLTKPKLTRQQLRILTFLYRYRFLTSVQIQQLLQHKDRGRINIWLSDLRDLDFITWRFHNEAGENMKPAICSLRPTGVRYLSLLNYYPPAGLSRRRRDKDRSPAFVDKCLMLANISILLTQADASETTYDVQNASDWETPEPERDFARDLSPDLWITETTDQEDSDTLLEIFEPTVPAYMVRKRIKDYIAASDEWQYRLGTDFLRVLFVCPTIARLIYAKRIARRLIAERGDPDSLDLYFTTFDQLRRQGFLACGWEQA
jgi:hypothetical protein